MPAWPWRQATKLLIVCLYLVACYGAALGLPWCFFLCCKPFHGFQHFFCGFVCKQATSVVSEIFAKLLIATFQELNGNVSVILQTCYNYNHSSFELAFEIVGQLTFFTFTVACDATELVGRVMNVSFEFMEIRTVASVYFTSSVSKMQLGKGHLYFHMLWMNLLVYWCCFAYRALVSPRWWHSIHAVKFEPVAFDLLTS